MGNSARCAGKQRRVKMKLDLAPMARFRTAGS
jgi:hypothetical protein